ncbi:hypothetical protein HDU87_003693, partial [Geranomyces variabilis]
MGPYLLTAIQQVILHHATVNHDHATMNDLYAAARTALSSAGIPDGTATGGIPVALGLGQRSVMQPMTPMLLPPQHFQPYGYPPQLLAPRSFYQPGLPP